MVEALCVEDMNVLDNCDQFLGNYKRYELLDVVYCSNLTTKLFKLTSDEIHRLNYEATD